MVKILTFFDFDHLQEGKGVQSWTKSANFGTLSKVFQTQFFSAKMLPLVQISVKSDHIWGTNGPKSLKNGHYMDADLLLKTFNLATTNVIMMKPTTIVCIHKLFHFAKK